jgi:hypothetical protein
LIQIGKSRPNFFLSKGSLRFGKKYIEQGKQTRSAGLNGICELGKCGLILNYSLTCPDLIRERLIEPYPVLRSRFLDLIWSVGKKRGRRERLNLHEFE